MSQTWVESIHEDNTYFIFVYFVHNRAIDTQALFLRQACSSEFVNGEKKNGEAWALFLLFVRGAWIAVTANTDLV